MRRAERPFGRNQHECVLSHKRAVPSSFIIVDTDLILALFVAVGSGAIDMGAKAMVHTIAGKARGFPIKSIGSLSRSILSHLLTISSYILTLTLDLTQWTSHSQG